MEYKLIKEYILLGHCLEAIGAHKPIISRRNLGEVGVQMMKYTVVDDSIVIFRTYTYNGIINVVNYNLRNQSVIVVDLNGNRQWL